MVKAVRIETAGGPEVLKVVDVDVGEPGPGQARVRHHACGLNFIDVYFRTGLYPQPMPAGCGQEGAGVVEAVGPDVTHVKPGDRVAYAGGPQGSACEVRVMPANVLVKLPKSIPFDTAAAMMLKGLTVQYLLRRTYRVQPGQTILFHAAAGGVGLIAMQWAKLLGATVIGTVGSQEKAELAKAHGCDHPIVYTRENFVERVKEITNGKGVPVVYDSIGRDTFQGSLDCLSPFGLMVSFGNASGPVQPFALAPTLKGSLYLTRPSLVAHTAKRESLEEGAAELFKVVSSGKVKIEISQRRPLAEVEQAYRDLEARKTTGSTVLMP
ncbi:MAG TPA: quinone oxidoreductase [Burkholderiaceae bacterium]|nr:quinone oxidoreductase [Burkholderiaceae bacterium]